jgi:hypothetical protein
VERQTEIRLTLASTEALYGLGRFNYEWRGDEIRMVDRETGAARVFSRTDTTF